MNKKIIPYLIGFLIFFAGTWVLLFSYDKAELHLLLNSCHNPVADVFFKYYSMLAEWPCYVIGLIPLLFYCRMWTIFYALSEIVGALITQILKHIAHAPRPKTFFQDIPNVDLPVVEGVHLHSSNSFPSGHSSTFFIFFTVIALLLVNYFVKNKETLRPIFRKSVVQQTIFIALLLLAILGGYSRIYLSQHFLLDVSVGSFIGVLVPCMIFLFFGKKIMKD